MNWRSSGVNRALMLSPGSETIFPENPLNLLERFLTWFPLG